ncbi:hypothetical protein ACOTXN_00225 [Enterobacter cloacae complex sp. IR53043]|nr:hypothetical protein [Enterobacter hormaechei]KTJ31155.1 hypothetical protein ASU88_07340 [Enterobacter hormaechei subsp. xiangfangensis]MBN9874906.1 hypothetical protein [Enterobacter hormaechei]HCT5775609.1 hypothetical protein [Enterobacter hormaechei]
MSNIDKQDSQVQRYANFGVDMMEWADGGYVKHSDYLALLDELEAKDKQIADLKEAFRIALSAAGIDAPAAAGKGEEL